jgi:hypothetical protein
MVLVGCTTVTDGAPSADTAVAPAYRESVSASVSESAATSSIRESRRQESLTVQAVLHVCEALVNSNNDAIAKLNDFIVAYNQGIDITASENSASQALEQSADQVVGNITNMLPVDLRESLNAYVEAARAAARTVAIQPTPAAVNGATHQLNATIDRVDRACHHRR